MLQCFCYIFILLGDNPVKDPNYLLFISRFLGSNPISSITFESSVLLLRVLLDKLDSTFWLLPGDFEESQPLAVFKMLTKHPSFEKRSQELCSVHCESMENNQNVIDIYAYLFQWILPFVRSLVQIDTVCMEVTREVLKFHIHLISRLLVLITFIVRRKTLLFIIHCVSSIF